MHLQKKNLSSTMSNHGNTISQKWNDSSPETKLKVMEDYDLNDREFKIAVVKKLKKIQENSGSSLSSGI